MFAEVLLATLLASAGPVAVDGVYPNPATPEDRGEFVLLSVPENATTDELLLVGCESPSKVWGITRAEAHSSTEVVRTIWFAKPRAIARLDVPPLPTPLR